MVKCEILVVYTVYNASKIKLHQSTATLSWWCGHQPRLVWVEMAAGLPKGSSFSGHSPLTSHFFTVLPPERPQKGSTQLLKNHSPVFSCLFLALLLILPLLLMSGNVHSNLCSVFPNSVCAENVIWRGRFVQRCT